MLRAQTRVRHHGRGRKARLRTRQRCRECGLQLCLPYQIYGCVWGREVSVLILERMVMPQIRKAIPSQLLYLGTGVVEVRPRVVDENSQGSCDALGPPLEWDAGALPKRWQWRALTVGLSRSVPTTPLLRSLKGLIHSASLRSALESSASTFFGSKDATPTSARRSRRATVPARQGSCSHPSTHRDTHVLALRQEDRMIHVCPREKLTRARTTSMRL